MPANVNASTLAPFSTALSRGGVLVIVGMLGGVVLLSLLGRVCGRGKGIRGFRGDDVLAVMAFVCAVGMGVGLVELSEGLGKGEVREMERAWVIASQLCYAVGMGMVRVGVSIELLRRCKRGYERRVVQCVMYIVIFCAMCWSVFVLLRHFLPPTTWDKTFGRGKNTAHPIHWIVNTGINALNVFISLALVILFLFMTIRSSTDWIVWLGVSMVTIFALSSCAAGITRTCLIILHKDIESQVSGNMMWTLLCNFIELTTASTASCVIFFKPIHQYLRVRFRSRHRHLNQHMGHFSSSSETPIYPPNAAYFPLGVTRFHDSISNLDFDIETPHRTRTHTMNSRSSLTRSGSESSQISGSTFTNGLVENAQGKRTRKFKIIDV